MPEMFQFLTGSAKDDAQQTKWSKVTLSPDNIEKLARARADLRMGVPVVLSDGVILAVETLSAERLHDLCRIGEPQLALTDWRARTLKAHVSKKHANVSYRQKIHPSMIHL